MVIEQELDVVQSRVVDSVPESGGPGNSLASRRVTQLIDRALSEPGVIRLYTGENLGLSKKQVYSFGSTVRGAAKRRNIMLEVSVRSGDLYIRSTTIDAAADRLAGTMLEFEKEASLVN